MKFNHENRKMREKHSNEQTNFWDCEQREANRECEKTPNSEHNIGRSCDPNAIAPEIRMKFHCENRKIQEKHSCERRNFWDFQRREAQMRRIAHLQPDRSRARKHHAAN